MKEKILICLIGLILCSFIGSEVSINTNDILSTDTKYSVTNDEVLNTTKTRKIKEFAEAAKCAVENFKKYVPKEEIYTVEEPSVEEPLIEEPSIEEPLIEEPKKEEPKESKEEEKGSEIDSYSRQLLAEIVWHEAGSDWISQYEKAQIAAGVMNRVRDSRFPNTVYDVLTQNGQFTGYWPGCCVPTQECYDAVDYYFAHQESFGNENSWWGDGYRNYFYYQ